MATLRDTLTYEPVELKFGTSGLRGLVTDMTDLECYINTLGFLAYLTELGQNANGVVYVAGDLRHSTPRVLKAVVKAVRDAAYEPVYCGLIPTPAVAYYALEKNAPCIMVTGSHIPDDRNGIKFYKADGEVLKPDEPAIKNAVAQVRGETYALDAGDAFFDKNGMLTKEVEVPQEEKAAADMYMQRHTTVFDDQTFKGKKIVFYQHSAVGRDMLVDMLQRLGSEVVPVGRSEKFIPIDTENVTPANKAYFKQLATEHPDAFAIVSTDGDSDRPFVIDENGVFNAGDVLGAVVATWLHADAVAFPLTSNDAANTFLEQQGIAFQHTKVGSPYVVVAMQKAAAQGAERVVGWEVNGGFMLGIDIEIAGKPLRALPTRDAIFPIIVALYAAKEEGIPVSELFGRLPQRFTSAGLINNFPTETSLKMLALFSEPGEGSFADVEKYFDAAHGFGKVTKIDLFDGVRIFFDNGDIAHMRPSGNAPQLRCYGTADTQARADEIVAMAIAEPGGIFRKIEATLQ